MIALLAEVISRLAISAFMVAGLALAGVALWTEYRAHTDPEDQ